MDDFEACVSSIAALTDAHATRGADYTAVAVGRVLGLARCAVNHETIEPGGRSSLPHAHSHEDEFVYVLRGTPTLWLDGHVRSLEPGACAAFPAGTGIAHSFLNDSAEPIELLIFGVPHPEDRLRYPLHPDHPHPRPWTDAPKRALGAHDGEARAPGSEGPGGDS